MYETTVSVPYQYGVETHRIVLTRLSLIYHTTKSQRNTEYYRIIFKEYDSDYSTVRDL